MRSTRLAKARGYDDALLLTAANHAEHHLDGRGSLEDLDGDNVILDGPTFSIGWFAKGEMFTPCWNRLGLLPSCTLDLVLEVWSSTPAYTRLHLPTPFIP